MSSEGSTGSRPRYPCARSTHRLRYSPASRTATRRRYRAIHVAAASPAGPPPTTIASNRSPDTWDSVPEHATGETEARDGEGGDGAARSRHGGDGEPPG